MIYAAYVTVAALVIFLSKKASDYIDLIEKNTSLSGAFLGGILLSAVTSLPELFTSISAVALIGEPGMCIGNILGSDLFNLAMLACMIPLFVRGFSSAKLSAGHTRILCLLLAIYAVMALGMLHILDTALPGINISTLLILILYAVSVKYLSDENGQPEPQNEQAHGAGLTVRQIAVRFCAAAVGIVLLSIVLTYITDIIAERLNLGAGLAGALFLGIATSLPEVSSTIALMRLGSYNIAVGNIVGSNMFNFLVLCIADMVSFGVGVYDYSDVKVVGLLLFGAVATALFIPVLTVRSRAVKIICCAAAAACYLAFLCVR